MTTTRLGGPAPAASPAREATVVRAQAERPSVARAPCTRNSRRLISHRPRSRGPSDPSVRAAHRHVNRDEAKMNDGPMRCSSCGHENPAGARFCNECGTALAAPTITPEPRAYTPRHLVEKILASQSALRGERKLVTVLFADVARSMEIAERVDLEEWHRLLDRLFRILAGGIHRYEGTINQYTGDGIMALFGAPIAHEDHAQRACAAALDLAREL